VRTKLKDIDAAGIERVPRVVGTKTGRPLLADGRILDPANIVWCSGYHHSFPWIDLPIFGKDGRPVHERGVVSQVPGMYFFGLHWQYAMSSATIVGVGRDAEYVIRALGSRPRASALERGDRSPESWLEPVAQRR
jgi:putative flavoprotein involved in K+ transport